MDINNLSFDLQGFKTAYDRNIQAFCIVYVSKVDDKYDDITFVYANKAYEKLSGNSLETLIGHTYTEIMGCASEQWNTIYGETAYGGKDQSLTVPGPEIDGIVSVQCFQIAPGFCASNVLDVTNAFNDIENARAETRKSWEQIDRERKMYQTLLDQSSAMVTVIDATTYKIVYANASARNVTKKLGIDYVGSVCFRSIAKSEIPCEGCILNMENAPEKKVREIPYGNRVYKMVYQRIQWDGREALMEYSEDITEQKQVIKMAEESAKLHENIISKLPTGVIVYKIVDHAYKIIHVNPAICKMMGLELDGPNGVFGEQILSLVLPEFKELIRDAAYKMATTGENVKYEFRTHIKNSDNIIWVAAEGQRSVQPDGNVYVYIGYKDITDSKEKELEFQQQVDFISNLSDETIISKGHHNLTQNTVISLQSAKDDGIEVENGTKYDCLIPMLQKTAINQSDIEKIGQVFNRENLLSAFYEGKRKFSFDYRRSMDGEKRIWATIRGSLYEEPISHDINAFLYSYDNTEQIQEMQIVNQISKLEYGLLALIDIKTHDYKAVYRVNTTQEQLINMHGDYEKLISERIMSPVVLGDRELIREQMMMKSILSELDSRKIYTVDYSVKNSDGSLRRMSFHYSYLDEMKDTVLLFTSDITENYKKEQEQIQRIEKAMYDTQEATRAKSAFFSRMSHDMRTPMNGILGLSGLSKEETDVDVLHSNMGKIHESGEYLLSLINDTLDVQRIESEKLNLETKIVNAKEMVENILDMVKTTADGKGVTLRFNKGNTDLNTYLKVDPVRIKQIFVNLLSNAVKFTPSGGTVEIKCKRGDYEGMVSHVIFTVADTGIGMSEEFLENGIFKPFSQESNAVTSNYAGSGLGLSIAKSLVEMMGGTIAVESEIGAGTTFTINLALEKVDYKIAKEVYERQQAENETISVVLSNKRVLLAEDHPLNAEITSKLLEKVGCKVKWMRNGQEALECFANSKLHTFDAILMDIRMPVMDGLEATKKIRALNREDAAKIPIIAMTANAYDEDIKKSLDVGMNAHLGKPIYPNTLYRTLGNYILK